MKKVINYTRKGLSVVKKKFHPMEGECYEFDPKHHYTIANPNSMGFHELELSNLTFLSINKS
jgi:hypothetical protein